MLALSGRVNNNNEAYSPVRTTGRRQCFETGERGGLFSSELLVYLIARAIVPYSFPSNYIRAREKKGARVTAVTTVERSQIRDQTGGACSFGSLSLSRSLSLFLSSPRGKRSLAIFGDTRAR